MSARNQAQVESPLIAWMNSALPPELVGQKALGVARLSAEGFAVPSGFSVTTVAWRVFATANSIPLILEVAALTSESLVTLRKGITSGVWPPNLLAVLEQAWAELAGIARWSPLRVAVRSSVVAEDLPEASFAGQYASVLNVTGLAEVQRAIAVCWESSVSDRVIEYAKGQRIRDLSLENAVLIQELVPAVSAGTAFSVNPVTGRRDELLIESTWGLGQAVVGGNVTPDTFLLERSAEAPRIKRRRLASKALAFQPAAAGAIESIQLSEPKASASSLAETEVLALAELVLAIERKFEGPQDIEWALYNGQLFILQARPVTALANYPGDDLDWEFVVKKRLAWFTEMLQLEGMSAAVFVSTLDLPFEFQNARMISYHEYLDAKEMSILDELLGARHKADQAFLSTLAARAYAVCDEVLQSAALLDRDFKNSTSGELADELQRFAGQMLRLIPVIYTEPDIDSLLLDGLQVALPGAAKERLNGLFVAITNARGELGILAEQRDLLGIGAQVQADTKLLGLFRRHSIGELLPLLTPDVRRRLDSHREQYAWINTDDVFGVPWELPDFLARLAHLVLSGDCQERLAASTRRKDEREQAFLGVVDELQPDQQLRALMEVSRTYAHLRTHRAEAYIRSLFLARRLLTEVGQRLHLSYDETVAFSHQELEAYLRARKAPDPGDVRRRRLAAAYIMVGRQVWPYFGPAAIALALREGLHSGDDIPSDAAPTDVIHGAPGNLGFARGTARVVHDITELEKVQQGDILIASMTIPEFVAAMEKAAAFVTDEGGVTCHAAIVSRELGVPCVIGTGHATHILHDGDLVEVDATAGTVRVVECPHEGN